LVGKFENKRGGFKGFSPGKPKGAPKKGENLKPPPQKCFKKKRGFFPRVEKNVSLVVKKKGKKREKMFSKKKGLPPCCEKKTGFLGKTFKKGVCEKPFFPEKILGPALPRYTMGKGIGNPI